MNSAWKYLNRLICIIFIAAALLAFSSCAPSESKKIIKAEIPPVSISDISDGSYTGEYLYKDKIQYKVSVTVRDNKIETIEVLSSAGNEYDTKALPVLDKVVEEQSLNVDAVSGATRSSKLYLICIYNALTGEEITLE